MAVQDAQGSSLLQLKVTADRLGWLAVGKRVSFAQLLPELRGPFPFAVVHLDSTSHFVAVLGLQGDRLIVADPRARTAAWSQHELHEKGWRGHVLLLAKR
jgi:ABC-type bacteriocin/lantibiotic exporter with double-glycine peptidase domain